MLDQETKRRIDSARDILVGKVPDPKAQVEQITTALIYKFMDDMDKEAEELGGKAEFFANGYEKYSWAKLMDKRLSGQERLDLYVQAISNMSKNPHIPQLFRDMFKDAFLPYRDYEVLSLFLKEIDWFSYEHSENLGDAFEYLLSVLGSQGEAGQFRTPRHIIDFIVEVVDPKKKENILDFACGTAGFLISSYKHIIKHNSSSFKPYKEKAEEKIQEGETVAETVLQEKDVYTGDKLSPEEKTRIMENIGGYDISPDMVKLSMVNLYLHGFSKPKVFEYDTLTSEKKWNESFDVIMANPPFMTPKGGIRPHKRFQVQASRSEVLFVDYILEHLNLNGRAGIIVPEGIIFQSANAYKRLRKLLIEDGLFAVVSLPPGVFNPYSGVKTSILFFDNQLAKKTDEILFVKVQNDGFDLGAQRRKIDKNDLPETLSILESWKKGEKQESQLAIWASKEKIVESGDYNLSGERYREEVSTGIQKWPLVRLGDVAEVISGQSPEGKYYNTKGEGTPFYQGKTEFENMFIGAPKKWTTQTTRLAEAGDILMSVRAPVGPVNITTQRICIGRGLTAIRPKEAEKMFLFFYLRSIEKKIKGNGGAVFDSINRKQIQEITIPNPPREVQKEIVEQIEVKQNAIEHAKEVIKNLKKERRYFGQSLRKLEDIEWIEIGKVCKLINGKAFKPKDWQKKDSGGLPIVRIQNLNNSDAPFNYYSGEIDKKFLIQSDDLLFSWSGSRGTSFGAHIWKGDKAVLNQHIFKVEHSPEINRKFLFLVLNDAVGTVEENLHGGVGLVHITKGNLEKIKIPMPAPEIQERLVAEVEKEEEIIKSNQRLISLMETKIANVLSEI